LLRLREWQDAMSDDGQEQTAKQENASEPTFWREIAPSMEKWPKLTLDAYGFPWFMSKTMTWFFLTSGLSYFTRYFLVHLPSNYQMTREDASFAAITIALLFFVPLWLLVDIFFNAVVYFIRNWLGLLIIIIVSLTIPILMVGVALNWLRIPLQ
jgi:hypothetical protein